MIHRALALLLFSLVAAASASAQGSKPAAGPSRKAEPAKGEEDTFSADTLNFQGQVTGTVASVDLDKSEMKVKVASVKADTAKSKAPKPDALAGRTINITPLLKKKDGKETLDETSVGYIKGAKAGDSVTISIRRSSKGVNFRLLKVPTSAGQ